jgi:hypothetical protein
MSSYPVIKGENKEKRLRIRVGNETFLLVVHENNNYVNLYAGGIKKYCIYIQLIKEGSQASNYFDPSIGNLSRLDYNKECNLNNALIKGDGTKQLVQVLTSYIRKYYPFVKVLKFTDTSTIVCDNGTTVSLAEMSYLLYGKTWYERTFNAYLDERSKQIFEIEDARLQHAKSYVSWELFCQDINNNPVCKPEWESIYNTSTTWHEFFTGIREKLGANAYCDIFPTTWFNSFISRYSNLRIFGLGYMLPIQQKNIDYNIEPYTTGGGRSKKTKKAKRQH